MAVGLGYVGLPLAVAFAEAGHDVVGPEKSAEKLAALEGGDPYVEDVAPERLLPLLDGGSLSFTDDYAAIGEADAVLVCLAPPQRSSPRRGACPSARAQSGRGRRARRGRTV